MKRLLFILMGLVCAFAAGQDSTDSNLVIPTMQSKKWALCIGVSNYSSMGKLAYSTKDCVTFADTLKSELGFSNDSVFVMADKEGYEIPTAVNVKKKVDEILARSQLDSGDLFVVYFSGHGVGFSDGDYWLPNDATTANARETGIAVSEILERLTKKKLRNVVIVSDACRAGEKNPFGRSLIELSRKTNIGVMLGCAPGAKSYESPKLGQGAFTYFLNKAIKTKSALDKSLGATLLSRLGTTVAKNVEEYTAVDYGENAQKPSIYAEKEQEVVLSTTTPSAVEMANYLTAYKQCLNIGQFSEAQYSDALSALSYLLHQEGRDEEALAVLRVLQSYGTLPSSALYTYVLICKERSTSYELNSALIKNATDDPNSLFDDLAVLHGGENAVGQVRFIRAIWNLYHSDSRDLFLPYFEPFLQKANAGAGEKEKLAQNLLRDYPANKLVTAYANFLHSSMSANQNDLEDTARALRELDTEKRFADSALRIQYRAYLVRMQYDKASEVVASARSMMPTSSYWEMRSLIIATLLRDPDLLAKAKAILTTTQNGETLISLVTLLRSDSKVLAPEFKAASDRLSGSMEAQIAEWIVSNLKDLKDFKLIPESIEKLAKGRYRASLIAYQQMNDLIGIGLDAGWISSTEAIVARTGMANDLSEEFTEIGEDPEGILLLAKLLNGTHQSYRLVLLGLAGPWENIEDRLVSGKAEFLRQFYIALLNNGFNPAAEKTFGKLETMGGVDAEILIRASTDAVFDNNHSKATKLLDRLKQANMTARQQSHYKLIAGYLAYEMGDKTAIAKIKDSIKDIDLNGLFFLEFVSYMTSNARVPSLLFSKLLIDNQPGLHDVWSVAIVNVYLRCLESNNDDAKEFLKALPEWAVSEPMNGNFMLFGYNPKADASLYVGHYEFKGSFAVKHTAYNGTFVVDVDAQGNLKGTIALEGEAETIDLSGPINGFGRGFFNVKIGDTENICAFALIPHKKYTKFKSDDLPEMQVILYSTSPFRMAFVVKGKKDK